HAGGAPDRPGRPGILVAYDAAVARGCDPVTREASGSARPAAVGHRLSVRVAGAGPGVLAARPCYGRAARTRPGADRGRCRAAPGSERRTRPRSGGRSMSQRQNQAVTDLIGVRRGWEGPIIDADVHAVVPSLDALRPHLSSRWT